MRDLHIACGQFAPEPGDKAKNVAQMIRQATEARAVGCELILFPELVVTGYLEPEQIRPLAEPLTGPSVESLGAAARKLGIAIAFGFAEVDEGEGALHNSLAVLDREGSVAGVYRKMHLWATEKLWAKPGARATTFDLGDVRCGGWICYDTRFPELARLLALSGTDVGLVSTAWLGPGDEWKLALRARALDNSMFVAGADIISYDPVLRCYGLSMIVGPKGNVLAEAKPEQEGIIHAVLKGQDLLAQRKRVPLLADRRPGLYGLLTR
ncbi:MAG: carbon-nitrogen hydrolase family protein [Chloroflexi bacterium]|nr:carbon-nitrogen hydrolase family protein [Chloroflexota bacterium]